MAQKHEIKKTAWARLRKEKQMKYWQNETLVKSNIKLWKVHKKILIYMTKIKSLKKSIKK